MIKFTFHLLLWLFRIFGLMPSSNKRWIGVVSKVLSGIHVIVNCVLFVLIIYYSERYFGMFSRAFYVYVGFALYGSCCITNVVNLVETLIYRKKQMTLFNHLYDLADDPSQQLSQKLFHLKLKGTILLPLLTVMICVWMCGMFKVFGLDPLVFVYFNSFILLRSAQVYMVADGIRIKLEIINECTIELLDTEKEKTTIDLKSVRARMEKIRNDYLFVKDLTICANSSGWSLLCLTLLYTCFMICTSYWFLLSLFKDIVMLESYQTICYILVTFLVLAIMCTPCTQCLNLSSMIGYNIHKVQQLGESPEAINQLATQITDNPIIFTMAGYFQLNYGLLASMLASTVTYLMILISFDNDQENKITRHGNESTAVNIPVP